jgi:hypothetical protein
MTTIVTHREENSFNLNIKFIFILSFSFLDVFHRESVEEKNDPDIIPHDNSDDEKDFERLYTPTQLNFVNRHSPSSNSPTLRFNEKQVKIMRKHSKLIDILLSLFSVVNSILSFHWPRIQGLHSTATLHQFVSLTLFHHQQASTTQTQRPQRSFDPNRHPTFTHVCQLIHVSHYRQHQRHQN